MAENTLLIRADANTHIGTGHVMRCLALAQAWQDNGGTITFLLTPNSISIEERIKTEGMQVLIITEQPGSTDDAAITAEIAKKIESSWVVVDGYQFGADYQKILKAHDCRILFIDDYGHADHYYADIVLNQNIYADISLYKNYEPYTRFLLGTKYALIRKEFLKWFDWHRDIPEVARKILVTLGGSDPDNVTLKVIEAVRRVDLVGLEVKVVVGGENPHFDRIHETVKDLSNFTLIKNAENMPELMAWADIAISAGGSTCWELAFLGTPVITISIADNQKPVVLAISAQKAAVNLGDGHTLTTNEITVRLDEIIKSIDLRSNLSENFKKIVDGEGTSRVCMTINSDVIRLRKIRPSDCVTIWNWVNESVVRKSSFNPAYISIQEHKVWFNQKIKDPNCYFFIGLDTFDNPIGQIRFDLIGDIAIVDISIDKDWRSKGFAKKLLDQGIRKLRKFNTVKTLKAYIKKENLGSIKIFMANNFEFSENKIIKNFKAITLSRRLL